MDGDDASRTTRSQGPVPVTHRSSIFFTASLSRSCPTTASFLSLCAARTCPCSCCTAALYWSDWEGLVYCI